ncbi:sugar ABC transporter permease [uncultured Georgenia sp.]|uniref:carbohydrate ABC transporter permease n=1 Tax=uncultured Georgenia sp. TaxID=378209 RepID=UPI00262F5EC0|nr:sugar ABC transporter permease [uncultured Georgenia sp.]HLS41025.1 sugar ABC transporter permease [Ornithinicoccus sp.]
MATVTAPVDQRSTVGPPRRRRSRLTSPGALIAYVFILPYVAFFLLFRILPTLYGIVLSFGDYGLSGTFELLGLDNYQRLFADPLFWNALKVTGLYAAIAIPVSVTVSLAMAQLCNRVLRGMSIYRSIFFLPVVTSPVLSGLIFIWIFSADGPINSLLGTVGLSPGSWLQSSGLVLPALALVSAWMNFGYNMLILLAGMLAIPQEYYEAAQLDGAGPWRRFRSVTLPLLKPALFFVLVLETVKSFQAFDTIYVMTGGGPVRASYTLTFMVYDQGFGYFDFGYASAVGVVLLLITLVFSLIQRRLVGRSA